MFPPQNEEGEDSLEIDENMSLLERVETYCASGVAVQRLVYVRELSSCAEEVGASVTMRRLVPLLGMIACDAEDAVRQVRAPARARRSSPSPPPPPSPRG